jgi:hypothetical protein
VNEKLNDMHYRLHRHIMACPDLALQRLPWHIVRGRWRQCRGGGIFFRRPVKLAALSPKWDSLDHSDVLIACAVKSE